MPPRRTKAQTPLDEVPLAQAARSLAALVRRLPHMPDGRIALTVGGELRAWLVYAPAQAPDPPAPEEAAEADGDEPPTRTVSRFVKRALKSARE